MSGRSGAADVIVAGAGATGCTLAALLARAGVDCILLDPAPRPGRGDVEDPRSLALTLASRAILEVAGAWDLLPADRLGRFRRMRVWDEAGDGVIEFDSADVCAPTLGYVVAQSLLEDALHRCLQAHRNVTRVAGAPVRELSRGDDLVTVRLEDGRDLRARLLVGADGNRSTVRQLAGIDQARHDYGQHAVACLVEHEYPHGDVARQRFLARGPLAFLPLAEPRRSAVIWSTAPDHAAALAAADAGTFHDQLREAFADDAGAILASSGRAVFPLQRSHAERYCLPRLALAGDAAHCVHPLAGQGANLGLLDAAALAEVLLAARDRGRDPGALPVLRRYERWRRGENAVMLTVLDGLQRLFESDAPAVAWARNTGLALTDAAGPLKRAIMRRASGLDGDLPAIARHWIERADIEADMSAAPGRAHG